VTPNGASSDLSLHYISIKGSKLEI
jgi:hypothetical protein